jgi:hypothetical protein
MEMGLIGSGAQNLLTQANKRNFLDLGQQKMKRNLLEREIIK